MCGRLVWANVCRRSLFLSPTSSSSCSGNIVAVQWIV
jgi:hypothetical protein